MTESFAAIRWLRTVFVFVFAVLLLADSGLAQRRSSVAAPPPQLLAEIARIAERSQGVVGVSAIDLQSGATVEYNADQPFAMASTFKLPLAAFAFQLADDGGLSLTEPHPMTRDMMLEPGILNEYFRHPGLSLSTLNAIELSITRSDNGATDFIFARVGGPSAVGTWLAGHGFADIRMGDRTIRETFEPASNPAAPTNNLDRTTTPRAMTRFLAALHRNQLLSAASTTTLMDILGRTVGDRISLHLPPGVQVLHKTGTLFSPEGLSVNDIGYIRAPDGHLIALSIFIRQSPASVSHATRDAVIGHIARSLYDHFMLMGR